MSNSCARDTPYARWTHAALRVFASAVYLQHGAQKLFGALGGHVAPIGTLPWAGGMIEIIAGTLIFVGLFTRVAAFVASGEMAVAYFMFHAPRALWPVRNHGEVALLLCFVFLYLSAVGAGALSLDHLIVRRRPQPVMPRH